MHLITVCLLNVAQLLTELSYFEDPELSYFVCSKGTNDPRGGAIFNPRGMVGRINKEDQYTLLQT